MVDRNGHTRPALDVDIYYSTTIVYPQIQFENIKMSFYQMMFLILKTPSLQEFDLERERVSRHCLWRRPVACPHFSAARVLDSDEVLPKRYGGPMERNLAML